MPSLWWADLHQATQVSNNYRPSGKHRNEIINSEIKDRIYQARTLQRDPVGQNIRLCNNRRPWISNRKERNASNLARKVAGLKDCMYHGCSYVRVMNYEDYCLFKLIIWATYCQPIFASKVKRIDNGETDVAMIWCVNESTILSFKIGSVVII